MFIFVCRLITGWHSESIVCNCWSYRHMQDNVTENARMRV